MTRRSSRQRGLTVIDVTVICVVVLILVVILLPMLAFQRRGHGGSRMMQNSTQLRGIHQGMFTYAQMNKTGGRDGWYPGLDAQGRAVPAGGYLPGGDPAAGTAVPGYAAEARDHVLRAEMNPAGGGGFLPSAFAELLTGDFIPAGSAGYFINPADTVKTQWVPGAAFTAANVSYTVLDLSRNDGGVYPFTTEWKESINTRAIVLADRAVGDGNDFGTRSSVWTDPGSGEWKGSLCRNDGSTSFEASTDGTGLALKYGKRTFENGDTLNLFSGAFALNAAGEITADSGLLYDEADDGTDPEAL